MAHDDPINPAHYKKLPKGFGLECIEYTEGFYMSQGTALKYVYRCGNKDSIEQDLNKTLWYIERALSNSSVLNIPVLNMMDFDPEKLRTIEIYATLRTELFYLIARGELHVAKDLIHEIINRNLTLD